MIIADDSADPVAMALDLLAQAEHGADSPAVLASDDPAADRRGGRRLWPSCRTPIGPDHAGRVCEHAPGDRAGRGVRARAPARSRPATPRPSPSRITRVRGRSSSAANCATAFGDYVAGSNHVLPTGGAARYASALGPTTFLRRMSVVEMTDEAVEALTPHLAALADAEGFPMHRRSAEARRAAVSRARRGAPRRRARPTCACAVDLDGTGHGPRLDRRRASSTTCSPCSPATR